MPPEDHPPRVREERKPRPPAPGEPVHPAPRKERPSPQMASAEHLRSIGTLVTPHVHLPAMTTAQADSLEIELVSVRRNERADILRRFLTRL